MAYIYFYKTTFSTSQFLHILLLKNFYIKSFMAGIMLGSGHTMLSRRSSGSKVITV